MTVITVLAAVVAHPANYASFQSIKMDSLTRSLHFKAVILAVQPGESQLQIMSCDPLISSHTVMCVFAIFITQALLPRSASNVPGEVGQ
jgi:hypothetical protein